MEVKGAEGSTVAADKLALARVEVRVISVYRRRCGDL
jgi:hypothetical protein